MRAIAMLRNRKRRDAGDVLMEVVADRRQAVRFRQMAAMGLYELGGDSADQALSKAAEHADPMLAGTIAMGIGRTGTAERQALVDELAEFAAPPVKERAVFASSLLAYRHGLDGHEVRFPTTRQLQNLGRRKANPIKISRASAATAKVAAAALKSQPLDVSVSRSNALSIQCSPNDFVWLWTDGAARRGFGAASDSKAVVALLFRKSRFENRYSLSAIALGTPVRGEVRLTIHRAESGKALYAGKIDKAGRMKLRARAHPGVAAIDLRAGFKGPRVEVEKAMSAAIVHEARSPKAG
jgi:hypothetical protein